jgi:hypothetical protein
MKESPERSPNMYHGFSKQLCHSSCFVDNFTTHYVSLSEVCNALLFVTSLPVKEEKLMVVQFTEYGYG